MICLPPPWSASWLFFFFFLLLSQGWLFNPSRRNLFGKIIYRRKFTGARKSGRIDKFQTNRDNVWEKMLLLHLSNEGIRKNFTVKLESQTRIGMNFNAARATGFIFKHHARFAHVSFVYLISSLFFSSRCQFGMKKRAGNLLKKHAGITADSRVWCFFPDF